MKPARYQYYDPATLDEAIELLGSLGSDAKVLAGGQSLVPVLNMRLARPQHLIDLNRIPTLSHIRVEGNQLRIGGLTRHAAVEHSSVVAEHCPLLHEAVRWIGHAAIRSRGTIGGSLAHADPAAELTAVLLALDGELIAHGPQGERLIPASEFFLSYFMTTLQPDEILTEVRLPILPPGSGTAFSELARRHGDFAIVGVACFVTVDDNGQILQGRMALNGVGPTPVRVPEAEVLLQGKALSPELLGEVSRAVMAGIDPDGDIHAPAEYRRHLAGLQVQRALKLAYERAMPGAEGGGR